MTALLDKYGTRVVMVVLGAAGQVERTDLLSLLLPLRVLDQTCEWLERLGRALLDFGTGVGFRGLLCAEKRRWLLLLVA